MIGKRKISLKTFCPLIVLLIFLGCCDDVYAYIGPGAGFAVAGSFLVMLMTVLSVLIAFLTWPIRGIYRFIKFRRIYSRSRFKRVVILGLDGMDWSLTEKWLSEGKLPNFAKLRDQGSFKALGSTIPPISPVAWSSFQTGSNPGKTNIFDFLTRDVKSYGIKLSSVDIRAHNRKLRIGKYQFPLGSADIRLLRKSVPFWKVLGDNGIFSSVIRVPITFPAEKIYGVQLSAMCTPDLRGSQGMFSYFTTKSDGEGESIGGEFYRVKIKDNIINSELIGPQNPMLASKAFVKCPFEVTLNGDDSAKLKINGKTYSLAKGKYSDWIEIEFTTFPGRKISGICRFLLKSVAPDFQLYVTPINIDPEKPVMPISYPRVYSTYLAKRQGKYATLGLAEDTWALNEKLINDDDFLEQCFQADDERERMFFDSLDNIKRGLCICVFDGTDRVQHTFWRQLDQQHPANDRKPEPLNNTAVENIYKRADTLLGKVLARCNDDQTLIMVISDHGFNTFRYGVDLNCWLVNNGYMTMREENDPEKNLESVDWSKTQAFAIGLSGIFLNLQGRESQGIVEPKNEAPRLREEIAEKLGALTDPIRKQSAVKRVYNAWKIYRGPYRNNAPDLIVGYQTGYRASWETAVGKVTNQVFHDNIKCWSGDHCIDHSLVPGVLFCNQKIDEDNPGLIDIGPTVLDMFGIKIPAYMDGRPLQVS